jgi:hypothetical protein
VLALSSIPSATTWKAIDSGGKPESGKPASDWLAHHRRRDGDANLSNEVADDGSGPATGANHLSG